MGLLDNILGGGGQAQRRPGLGDTVAAGVVLALLVKAIRQHQAANAGQPMQSGRSFDPQAQAQAGGGLGGMLGGLGGMLGGGGQGMGGGLGGLLGSLGGAGALGALVSRFQQSGHGQQAQSWVSSGQNQPIAPHEMENALGGRAIDALQQQTGLPREQLLGELARELPQAIHDATPEGRLPQNDEELHEAAQRPAPQG